MIKLLFIIGLLYVSYRLFIPKKLETKKDDLLKDQEPDEYVDYEEVE